MYGIDNWAGREAEDSKNIPQPGSNYHQHPARKPYYLYQPLSGYILPLNNNLVVPTANILPENMPMFPITSSGSPDPEATGIRSWGIVGILWDTTLKVCSNRDSTYHHFKVNWHQLTRSSAKLRLLSLDQFCSKRRHQKFTISDESFDIEAFGTIMYILHDHAPTTTLTRTDDLLARIAETSLHLGTNRALTPWMSEQLDRHTRLITDDTVVPGVSSHDAISLLATYLGIAYIMRLPVLIRRLTSLLIRTAPTQSFTSITQACPEAIRPPPELCHDMEAARDAARSVADGVLAWVEHPRCHNVWFHREMYQAREVLRVQEETVQGKMEAVGFLDKLARAAALIGGRGGSPYCSDCGDLAVPRACKDVLDRNILGGVEGLTRGVCMHCFIRDEQEGWLCDGGCVDLQLGEAEGEGEEVGDLETGWTRERLE
ncbi:hypothetical protein BDZ85DRAFT_246544 [Elsinoe ampelina]|uniref:Uncharacterized protein n=1 Tax=Elsinoe ampelina TaxID=302913 RepID=A0A6A6GRK1_9PEZI|nr:hypothetical protein BDZ85DRAFT_246544 [Elsinoe ampelina]